MTPKEELNQFLFQHADILIDVRSPSEYRKGHIPHAINYPLFSDEERKLIGTLYKQRGKENAVSEGFKIVGPRLHKIIDDINELCPDKKLNVHCWRGGMRSQSISWLLSQAGFKTHVLDGGYKAYRKLVRNLFESNLSFKVITGGTGVGKTDILKALEAQGEQMLDLEGLANHKGSTFGAIGQDDQPSIEHFENLLAAKLLSFDWDLHIWVEDESRRIGKIYLHEAIWKKLNKADYVKISIPLEDRVKRLVHEYGHFDKSLLAGGIKRIGKRLGPQHMKHALEALHADDLEVVVRTCLVYYDKSYNYCLKSKLEKPIKEYEFSLFDASMIAEKIKTPD